MSERINHAAKARIYIDTADARPFAEWLLRTGESKSDWIAVAQVHATLALVEQQRIANLIAYVNKWTDGELLDVDAEIRKALGIE